MDDTKFELIKFVNDELELDVRVDNSDNTVWLTQKEMSILFNVSVDSISLHIKNILKDSELDISAIEESFVTASDGKKYKTKLYNLDMIISVGYRVKSKNGIIFRKWATKLLKEYLIKGYAINEKRIEVLNKTIEIQNKMLSHSLNIDSEKLVNVINEYSDALDLLDDYDHIRLTKPTGNAATYCLTYEECRKIIDNMKFNETSNLFGVEKEKGKLNGILVSIYQTAFGDEIYPTLEEKASHLLYFLIKDHPFVDGCKRIAATLFLEYLNKNNALVKNNKLVIDNDTLVAIVILVAESKPEEMEIIINLVMNFLCK